jgi:hypothetical protein
MRISRSVRAVVLSIGLMLTAWSVFAVVAAPGQAAPSPVNGIPLSPCVLDPASCGVPIPDGSVVGELPFDQVAFYAPGKITGPTVIINAGTYWVTGIGTADDGSQFYRIVIGCMYLYVPIDTMQPSYQAPWNGEPLPTNEVSVDPPSKWCKSITVRIAN